MAVRIGWWLAGTGLVCALGSGCSGALDEPQDDSLVGVQLGPEGGLLASQDGVLSIIIPPGALSEVVVITVGLTTESPASLGTAYRVQPSIDLAVPAIVAYRYTGVELDDRDPTTLALAFDGGGAWEPLTSLGVDPVTQQVAAQDSRLSFAYGLIESGNGGTDTEDSATGTTGATGDTSDTENSATDDPGSSSSDDGPLGGCGDGMVEAGELCLEVGDAIEVGAGLIEVAIANFDDDDADDVVTIDAAGDLFVLLGDGAAGLGEQPAMVLGLTPTALAVADIDREGTPDVLLTDATGNVQLLPALGDGTFAEPLAFPVGAQPVAIATGDFDLDGHADVVTLDGGPNMLTLLLSDGAGGLAMVDEPFPVAANPLALTLGDFNGDGNLDGSTTAAGLVSVLAGNGDTLFGPPFDQVVPGSPSDVAAGDVNEDGRLDVVVTAPGLDAITLLFGNGLGGFGGAIPFAVGIDPRRVLLADIDHDGHLDAITVNAGDDSLSVLIGDGMGGLAPAMGVTVGPLPVAAAVADLDDDGALDLVVAHDAEIRVVRSNP
ncbi:MAG: VCBS repeat-containing protein [Deltaproteobacteria bacterium]|nr:VCBS repeat-containing protein [Deltaproteobacteria bacterium]